MSSLSKDDLRDIVKYVKVSKKYGREDECAKKIGVALSRCDCSDYSIKGAYELLGVLV